MRDGGFNCQSTETGFICSTIEISAASACKGGDEMGALFLVECRQPLILYSIVVKESPPSIKAPNLLLISCVGKPGVLIDDGLSDDSQEVISSGRVDILKDFGICFGKR